MRPQAPFGIPSRELPHALGEGLRLAPREIAPEHADHRSALEECEIERQLRNLACGEAHDKETPAPGERAERGLGIGAADWGRHHVDAAPLGHRLDALA